MSTVPMESPGDPLILVHLALSFVFSQSSKHCYVLQLSTFCKPTYCRTSLESGFVPVVHRNPRAHMVSGFRELWPRSSTE